MSSSPTNNGESGYPGLGLSEHAVAALMYAGTDDPPPAAVDIARTMADGRRERNRRRLIPAVAALVVLALGAGVAALPTFGGGSGAVGTPRVTISPSPSVSRVPIPVAPSRFDPLRDRLRVGWVPDGLTPEEPVFADGAQHRRWSDNVIRPAGSWGSTVDVMLYAADIPPWELTVGDTTSVPAPETGLPDAMWITRRPSRFTTLAWRWASNGWASVVATAINAPAERSTVERIAHSVSADADTPLRLPFSVNRPPAPLVLTKVELNVQTGGLFATLSFGWSRTPSNLYPTAVRPDAVTITVSWQDPGEPIKYELNRTIDGHPASVEFDQIEWGAVTLFPQPGQMIDVSVLTPEAKQLIGEQKAIELARSVRLFGGDASHRDAWTTTPLS